MYIFCILYSKHYCHQSSCKYRGFICGPSKGRPHIGRISLWDSFWNIFQFTVFKIYLYSIWISTVSHQAEFSFSSFSALCRDSLHPDCWVLEIVLEDMDVYMVAYFLILVFWSLKEGTGHSVLFRNQILYIYI